MKKTSTRLSRIVSTIVHPQVSLWSVLYLIVSSPMCPRTSRKKIPRLKTMLATTVATVNQTRNHGSSSCRWAKTTIGCTTTRRVRWRMCIVIYHNNILCSLCKYADYVVETAASASSAQAPGRLKIKIASTGGGQLEYL